MRQILTGFLTACILLSIQVLDSQAQFKDDIPSTLDRSGSIVKAETNPNQLFGLVNFKMAHSYEMTMGSFGGNTYNQNMYTNTMLLSFSDRLTGRVDLSIAHSPFGNSIMGSDQGAQFFVRNAELRYDISDNANITVSYRQLPYSTLQNSFYGNPFYSPFRDYRRSSEW